MLNYLYKKTAAFLLAATLLSACSTTADKPASLPGKRGDAEPPLKLGPPLKVKSDGSVLLYPTEFVHLAGWNSDNHAAAFSSFQRSCASWRLQPDERILGGAFELGRVADWKRLCSVVVPSGEEKQFFEKWFRPYAVADSSGFDGLFTGYFLPELHGSYQKSARFHVPVYGMPRDLLKRGEQMGRMEKGKFVPYYERAEIAAGALAGKKRRNFMGR